MTAATAAPATATVLGRLLPSANAAYRASTAFMMASSIRNHRSIP